MGNRLPHRLPLGTKVDLQTFATDDASAAPGNKVGTQQATALLTARIAELQKILWARQQERVLVVLQGIDTSGKGGTINRVFSSVNPAGLRVTSFKAPSEAELARDFLWRVHANVPSRGEIGVFDRSHYEDVLAVRVLQLVPETHWRKRYAHINAFESMLADEGTTIVKLFLHLSKDEQKKRLQARLDTPSKHWKFEPSDLQARAHWNDWHAAFAEMLTRTNTKPAPWHVIPADRKWYRDWAAATIMLQALERLNLHWPAARADTLGIVIDKNPSP
ncbi:MAG: polyphosphate kinase 2 family protein [Acidimicrobiia bacterium]|nr:polyphosphate kinase 2 family protein [Acidimicrobiia bacterium]